MTTTKQAPTTIELACTRAQARKYQEHGAVVLTGTDWETLVAMLTDKQLAALHAAKVTYTEMSIG
jgi:hypothetical protein